MRRGVMLRFIAILRAKMPYSITESCIVDKDGYLVILMNTIGSSKDHLYRTKVCIQDL